MDRLQIDTSQNVAVDVKLAGLGDRLIAILIDYLILGAYLLVVMLIVGIALTQLGSVGGLGAVILLASLPVLLYFLLCEIFLDGQTIGKRVMNIQVTRRDGTPASVGNYVVRWLLRPVDITLTGGLAAVLSILASGTGQRLGDLAAGTTVVRVDTGASIDDLSFADTPADGAPHLPEVDRLQDDDVATATQVLNMLQEQRPLTDRQKQLATRTQRALSQKMGISSELPPQTFLETVIQSYTAPSEAPPSTP